jgi:hypothetical protein
MSDADGFGTGGTSNVFKTGASSTGAKCDTSEKRIDFEFQTNKALQQCRPYEFSGFDAAVPPVTIVGLIPGGQSTVLVTRQTGSYEWMANVESGTSMIFFVVDAAGQQGGSSDLNVVGASDESTCLNSSSPSSTAIPAPGQTSGPTSTGSPATPTSPSNIPPTSDPTKHDKISAASVAGAVVGVSVLALAAVVLGVFLLRRRRDSARANRHNALRIPSEFDLNESSGGSLAPVIHPPREEDRTPGTASYLLPAGNYEPVPFTVPPPIIPAARNSGFSNQDRTESGSTDAMSAAQRKAAMAGTSGASGYRPARFIVHTDVEEAGPMDEDELIELPPQYSASRAPIPSLRTGDSSYASSSANPPYPEPSSSSRRYP